MTTRVQCVDSNDTPLFVEEKLTVHQGEGIRHRAVSVYLFSPDYQSVLIQQRAAHKYHSPLVWQNTCCTHPYINEDTQHSAERRLFEEMGLAHIPLKKILHFEYKTPV
jgi:isopentenyl-diphosphate delta-isomerase